ncbi:MAG: replicative DNA helicase [bacterium]|nr:replicative DNA helicase [bacterium]MCX7917946.1 replicative DNA helicase [bacterium]MDW8164261.1 replicative DNA helicase [Candidatus Omnitrophota bacterium]
MPRKKEEIFTDKIPPQNIEAEKALLGCMLIDEEAKIKVLENFKKEFFYSEAHQKIFSSISKLFEKGEKCDLITLTEILKAENALEEVGGIEYLSHLVEIVPTSAYLEEYMKIVKEKYLLRALISNATKIISEAYSQKEDIETLLDKAESLIFEVSQNKIEKEAYPLKTIVKDAMELIEKIHERKGFVTGLPTGFIDLDKLTTGLHPSDFIVIASRPSIGKTAFACNIALNLNSGVEKVPVLIFSLEMSKEQIVQRMLCCEARVNILKLRQGVLSEKDIGNLLIAASRLEEMPIFIDDTPSLNIFELRARARRLKAKENIQVIIIDYLQLMRGSGRAENRQQEISEISASLKSLAKELNIPVIAVSQLSRATEQREKKRPQLADLRESGSIEQDADLVLLLYREEYYKETEENKGLAEVIIAKQRNGPVDTVLLTFISEYTRFENYTPRKEI